MDKCNLIRKSFFPLLFLPTLGWASYQPITGSSVTIFTTNGSALPVVISSFGVNASTIAVSVLGTPNVIVSAALPPGSNQIGTIQLLSGTANVGNVGITNPTMNVTSTGSFVLSQSTFGVVNGGAALSVTATNTGFNVNNNPTVIISSFGVNASTIAVSVLGTPTVSISAGANVIGGMTAIPSQMTTTVTPGTGTFTTSLPAAINSITITPGTGTFTTAGTPLLNTITVTPGTGTWSITAIPSQVTETVTSGSGTWTISPSTIAVTGMGGSNVVTFSSISVLVSSTNLPAARADGSVIQVMGDNVGREAFVGWPGSLVKYSTATLSAITSELVFISSPGANLTNYLCGCSFSNTGSTASGVVLRQRGPAVNNTNEEWFSVPASSNTVTVWPGCESPFFQSQINSNITVQSPTSTAAMEVRCQYFTGT